MKRIEDLNTVKDVENLTTDEMREIDLYDITKSHKDFNNEKVSDAFAYQWVLRGL